MDTSPSQLDIGILVLDVNFHCTTPHWRPRPGVAAGLLFRGRHFYEVRDFDGPVQVGLVGPLHPTNSQLQLYHCFTSALTRKVLGGCPRS